MLSNYADKIDPLSTALLVMDIQNDFCADEGFFGKQGKNIKPIQEMVPRLKKIIETSRKSGVKVIFIKAIYDDIYLSDPIRLRYVRNNLPRTIVFLELGGQNFIKLAH